jgi:hypothetical protein
MGAVQVFVDASVTAPAISTRHSGDEEQRKSVVLELVVPSVFFETEKKTSTRVACPCSTY